MSESENEYWSDVENFPSHTKMVKICLNMKTDKKEKMRTEQMPNLAQK